VHGASVREWEFDAFTAGVLASTDDRWARREKPEYWFNFPFLFRFPILSV
jgi:hypothetical protein